MWTEGGAERPWTGWPWETAPQGSYLDACAGTFDLSLELSAREGFRGRVLASDFARPMLVEGIPKLEGRTIFPVCGDSLCLPFPDGTVRRRHGGLRGSEPL